jgi:hypothetical protein
VLLGNASQLLTERFCFSLHGTVLLEMAPTPPRPEAGYTTGDGEVIQQNAWPKLINLQVGINEHGSADLMGTSRSGV